MVKIVPYSFKAHGEVLAFCALDHYPHLFSNSKFNTVKDSLSARFLFGLAQAIHLDNVSDKLGQIHNENGSITTTQVLEVAQNPVGYIKYTSPGPHVNTGIIHQLAILEEYKNNKLGQMLAHKALSDFQKNKDLEYATLHTTSKEVGEKFYVAKLGFAYFESKKSHRYPDETLYTWIKQLRPD